MKAALHGLAFDLARELGARGGTANVIAPGFVLDTEFWAGRLTAESAGTAPRRLSSAARPHQRRSPR
jgi:NAD(P)-dependent dehydrogenase (short-subunit alcohol dehydrogenase family)